MFVQTKQSMVTLQHTLLNSRPLVSQRTASDHSVSQSREGPSNFSPKAIQLRFLPWCHTLSSLCSLLLFNFLNFIYYMAVFLSSQQFEWYKVIIPALNRVNKTREYVFFWLDRREKRRLFCFWYTLFFAGGLVLPLQEHLSLISCTCRRVSQRPDWLKGQRGNSMQSGMCCETVRCVITFCFYWP